MWLPMTRVAISFSTQVGRVVLLLALLDIWVNPSLNVNAGSRAALAAFLTCGSFPIWSKFKTVSPSFRLRYPHVT